MLTWRAPIYQEGLRRRRRRLQPATPPLAAAVNDYVCGGGDAYKVWVGHQAVRGALSESSVTGEAVDRIYVGNFAGELFNSQGHLGAAVAGADRALINKPSLRLEAACASGGLACSEAVRAIRAGDDVVLAVGAEVQTEADAR